MAIAERNNGFTLQESALALGISQPRVRDLEEAALRKFAERINAVVT
jgi:DNA-directed RNA polymerase sigma subunit (sigma70/sigma32)